MCVCQESESHQSIRRDHSLHSDSEGEMFVVAVYVDDIILGGFETCELARES